MATKKTEEVIKHEGKNYICTIPKFNFKGKLYTAEELADKPAVVAELLKEGFAGLVEKK